MADYSKEYTCTAQKECVPCGETELEQKYCLANGFKQEVACQWNGGVPKEYQDAHPLPEYLACDNLADVNRRSFFHYQAIFVILGVLAFAIYGWRRKKLANSGGGGGYRTV
ncbi:hypothetical protein H4R99_006522 [Coemansia sp. RSA 1722]|nr:hypothetical protein IWW45_006133 [Coemansia sp. RSA 485]KAJ2592092.1 hypothetical protein H4R99_006522 [Coemansia sp. RSA 1722]KAJ2634974.1 hypothetical protein GGF40_003881 [Coemansia sp. RSA 1286]